MTVCESSELPETIKIPKTKECNYRPEKHADYKNRSKNASLTLTKYKVLQIVEY